MLATPPRDISLLDELRYSEPLLSLYRAREYISDPEVLDYLDSLIVLTTKRIIRGKLPIAVQAEKANENSTSNPP